MSVPGPDALTVTALPVVSLVNVMKSAPVTTIVVVPSGAVVIVPYSLFNGKSTWTGKAQ